MKNVFRVLVLVILVLGFAAPAMPQVGGGGYDDLLQSQYVPDDWMELGANGASARVYYCSAKGSWGGYCVDCMTSNTQPNRPKFCGSAQYNASCNCESSCSVSGSCTYQR